MSHLNDGHVGCWERLKVFSQSEAEMREEYKRFLKCMEANHQIAHSPDPINHPSHYTQGGIDTFDFIKAKGLSYAEGNIIKYIVRARHKGNLLDDLKKAKWYLDQLIAEAENEPEKT